MHRSSCQGEGGRFGQALAGAGGGGLPASFSFSSPYGLMSPAQMFALAARRHMHRFGTTIDHFAEISVNARLMAANNPFARFRDPITVEDHHNSRPISDPLRLLDCCMESDGATAMPWPQMRQSAQERAFVALTQCTVGRVCSTTGQTLGSARLPNRCIVANSL